MSAIATVPDAEVEIVLDLNALPKAPTSPTGLAELWYAVESAVMGRDLRARRVHELEGDQGTVRFEVVRTVDGFSIAGPDTRFSIVGVRETAKVRYRCGQCAAEGHTVYGPFVCTDCGTETADNRVCDQHVKILDGALTATCGEHRPTCKKCGQWATFRCGGPRCHHDGTWCDAHKRAHPRDSDIDYCPPCFDVLFPQCESPSCTDLGTVRCEHVEPSGRPCGRRMCTRHARRWQVFGGERLGLGRCAVHQNLTRLGPDEVIHQIMAGAAARRRPERLPSLQGFAHTLRNCGHRDLALDYKRIFARLEAVRARLAGDRNADAAVKAAAPLWQRQLASVAAASDDGTRLVERLRQVIRQGDPRYGHAIADAISLAEYKPAHNRGGSPRPAMLFVRVPSQFRGLFIGPKGTRVRAYSEQLGVDVKIERD